MLLLVLAITALADDSKPDNAKAAEDQSVDESKQETKTVEAKKPEKEEGASPAAEKNGDDADSSKPKRGLHSWGYGFDDGFSSGGSSQGTLPKICLVRVL